MQWNKFLKIFLGIGLFHSLALAKCYYAPCDFQIQNAKENSKKQIAKSFEEVQDKLKELEKAYQEELDELIKINEVLQKQIVLAKDSLLESKELLFLLKQNNHLKANSIDRDSIKEGD